MLRSASGLPLPIGEQPPLPLVSPAGVHALCPCFTPRPHRAHNHTFTRLWIESHVKDCQELLKKVGGRVAGALI